MLTVRSSTAAVGAALMAVWMLVFIVFSGSGDARMTAANARIVPETMQAAQAGIQVRFFHPALAPEGLSLVGETVMKGVKTRREMKNAQKEAVKATQEKILRAEEERQEAAMAEALKIKNEKQEEPKMSYSEQDYAVLQRIVQAEAGGCDMTGKILVANVVLNRVRAGEFPDSVTDVVYQKSQFSPVSDGSINHCKVSAQTVEAVNRALSGEDYSQGALYFMNRGASHARNVHWFDRELTYLFRHESHEFYR